MTVFYDPSTSTSLSDPPLDVQAQLTLERDANYRRYFNALQAEQIHSELLKTEVEELIALMHDLMRVIEVDPELAQYPAAKAARELLAEKYSGAR